MSEKLPLVSVVIPCFNRAEYIENTIDSVLSQSYPNIEIIVVDDGCTDNSRAIIEKYSDRISILEHPGRINKGQSAALNLGIVASKGKYLALLDSDDLFAPEKIEKQVTFLENNPQFGLVYGNGCAIDETGHILYEFYGKNHVEKSDPNLILKDCYFLLPNNSLFRKEVLKKAGLFDESLRAAQDHDMLIRIAEVTKIAYIADIIFYYRRHKDSISQKNAKIRWKNGYKILKNASRRHRYDARTKISRFAVLNFRLAQCYREEGKWIVSAALFIAAGLCDPLRSLRVIFGIERISSPH